MRGENIVTQLSVNHFGSLDLCLCVKRIQKKPNTGFKSWRKRIDPDPRLSQMIHLFIELYICRTEYHTHRCVNEETSFYYYMSLICHTICYVESCDVHNLRREPAAGREEETHVFTSSCMNELFQQHVII